MQTIKVGAETRHLFWVGIFYEIIMSFRLWYYSGFRLTFSIVVAMHL